MFSAYIHIPFCRRRCYYCDFPITVLGDRHKGKISPWISEYVDFLCKEILTTPQETKANLETIFFGGGTPSLLPVQDLAKIINTINSRFNISKNAEISMEIDPATFDLFQLQEYKNIGINRISLGVQSFDDQLLEIIGRTHTLKDIFVAIDLINKAQFDNFSLDLISGLPYQNTEQWQFSLEKAIEIKPKHISCYDLVLESSTVFGKKYQAGDNPLPPDEVSANMYKMASQMLRNAGYNHYEISNYAQPNYECKHNKIYWQNKPFYGFGMGAASYSQHKRFTRPRTREKYFNWVDNLIKNNGILTGENLSISDNLLETLMLGLRLKEGINLKEIAINFGQEKVDQIINCVERYLTEKWILLDENLTYLKLTDPDGFLYSNVILSDLFALDIFDDCLD